MLTLDVPDTTIDGDVDQNRTADVEVVGRDNAPALIVHSDTNVICNLAIKRLALDGAASFANRVIDSYIGTDVDGLNRLPGEGDGLIIQNGAHDNLVENNIIAGNVSSAIAW